MKKILLTVVAALCMAGAASAQDKGKWALGPQMCIRDSLEAYYAAGAMGVEGAVEKGDALLEEYAQTLIEYIEYYLRFEGVQGDMVSSIVDDKLEELGDLYYLASYAGRRDIIAQLNAYYRTLGVSEDSLVDVGDKPRQADSVQIGS